MKLKPKFGRWCTLITPAKPKSGNRMSEFRDCYLFFACS